MAVLSWSKWWRCSPAQRKTARKKTQTRKCFLEVLEDRTLLSGNTYLVNLPGDAGTSSGQYSGDIRYCINQADKAANAGSTLTFDTAITGRTITVTNELAITQNMNIVGPGAADLSIAGLRIPIEPPPTIFYDGVRVFDITSQKATVNITGLTITDGVAEPPSNFFLLPNGSLGGNIYNSGNLTLNNCIVSNGEALSEFGGPTGRGGGIFNARGASLTISNTVVTGNLATAFPGGGLRAEGGGIYSDVNSSLYLTNTSQVTNNTAMGLNGTNGFTGSTGISGPRGAPGGPGTPGVDGGSAEGGGIYFAGSSLSIEGTSAAPIVIANNLAQGGTGGNGGHGGVGGKGTVVTGGTGGVGGAGGIGGAAIGGGFYATGGNLLINGAQFLGNRALGGNGGKGGTGGTGGTGVPTGRGGTGGAGGNSLAAMGGGLYNQGGSLSIGSNSVFTGNVVVSGNAGAGGNGGSGGFALPGPSGGIAGNAAYAYGGAIAMLAGSLNVSTTTFGGVASGAGNVLVGGNGGHGGNGGPGFPGGPGTIGGTAAPAFGGAIFVGGNATNLTLNADNFIANSVKSGTGGTGGNGAFIGGAAATGGIGGAAGGGAVAYYLTQGSLTVKPTTVSVSSSQFSQNSVTVGNGGIGGRFSSGFGAFWHGNNAQNGSGGGLFVFNQAGVSTVGISSSTFNRNRLQGGIGGIGNVAGNGSPVFGGGVAVNEAASTANSVSLTSCQLSNNTAVGGSGGSASTDGGVGGSAEGGGLYVSNGSLNLSQVSITSNVDHSGAGGFSVVGPGGAAGLAAGGGLSANAGTAPVSYVINSSTISSNALSQGNGGIVALKLTFPAFESDGNGGDAGQLLSLGLPNGAWGAGASLIGGTAQISNSHFDSNSGAGGQGGFGGTGTRTPSVGGNGGSGGAALGGGLFYNNNSGSALTLTFSNSTASNNQLTGGTGGAGGRAGFAGKSGSFSSDYVPGGIAGQGGNAMGGGIYILAGALSSNSSSISEATLDNNAVTGGTGGNGGAGSSTLSGNLPGTFAAGGNGGRAAGGGVYNDSLNSTALGKLSLGSSTMAGNTLAGGEGGLGGSGTTPNGGPGGNGGNGGDADGGGLCNDTPTNLIVLNSTIGGMPTPGFITAFNGNQLTGGSGGAGGNAGLPSDITTADGGNGGNGGNASGGGVFDNSGASLFVNNTIVNNQALAAGIGGNPGDGAGTSGTSQSPAGLPGTSGLAGAGAGGGMYVTGASATLNAAMMGNNIISLNSKLSSGAENDVAGIFSSEGNNILGSTNGTSGWAPSDLSGQTTQLMLGSLVNNGGPTPTCSLAPLSVAIGYGSTQNLLSGQVTDQRGFSRTLGNKVDAGAYEYQAPTINPPSGLTNGSLTNNEGDQVSVAMTSTDANASAWTAKGLPTGLKINAKTGVISGTIAANAAGFYSVTVSAKDYGTNGSITFGWNVNDSTPPVLTSPGQQTSNAGDNVNLGISATDADSFSDKALPPGLTINTTTGVISGTIDGSAAGNTYLTTITATDNGFSSTIGFHWVVNAASAGSNGGGSSGGGNGSSSGGGFPLAGLLGLALEEFELTYDSFLADFFASMGQSTDQLQAQIQQLTNTIYSDPLASTYWGQLAIQLGQSLAQGTT